MILKENKIFRAICSNVNMKFRMLINVIKLSLNLKKVFMVDPKNSSGKHFKWFKLQGALII